MSDYYKILLSNRAEPSQEALSRAIEPRATPEPRQEPSQRQEPEPSQEPSRAIEPITEPKAEPRAEPIAKSHARAKPRGKRQGNITLYHYSQADFKKDLKRVYSILPKNLKAIKINFVDYGLAGFSSGLYFNYKGLIEKIELKKAFEKYLNKGLTIKEYLIYVILHEFGHYQRHITCKADYNRYRQEDYFFEPKADYIDRQFDYWTKITEEVEAWKFTKKYIKKVI